MTLRARLTAAFLAVVLGPVLLGAFFVGMTVTAVNRDRAAEELDRAEHAVRAAVEALCARLRASATAVAVLGGRPASAGQAVRQGLAAAVRLDDPAGIAVGTSDAAPPPPWAVCGQPAGPVAYTALAARAELRDSAGTLVGYAYAAEPVDDAMLGRLAAGAGGATLTLTSDPGGAYRHRLAGPLPLTVSVPEPGSGALLPVLLAAVLLCAGGAVVVAWWLARGTTRPLAELAVAVGRVAAGDLTARVPVRTGDEVGHLAATFNRMTRELQSYVTALTASRDQLRGHLAVLGDTLSSTHDLDRILAVIVQTACAATGAQSGAVLPAAGDESQPRRGRIDGRSYMAVPFRTPDSEPGVLTLYDRLGDDEFDDTDLVTLRTFAGQAAIAVQNVRLHEEARRLSHTDALTGLYNYRTLAESLRREIERANRFGHRLCVLALDLDRFKAVNDSYGHGAGDAVLVEFARRVRAVIREVDLAFRRGGEEFVVLLPETDALGGSTVAQRIGAAIRGAAVVVPPHDLAITVSIGIAVFPDHGATGADVLEIADRALYAAKAAGRDTFALAQPATVGSTGGASGSPDPAGPGDGR